MKDLVWYSLRMYIEKYIFNLVKHVFVDTTCCKCVIYEYVCEYQIPQV